MGGTARQCRGAPSKKGTACQSIVGGTVRQCRGSALGKEGRKYGVGMGKNCPFMHGKRLLYPTNYWVEVSGSGGKNAPNIEL